MKDIYQVLREKEQAVARLRREIEALRFCAPMLAESGEAVQPPSPSPTPATSWGRHPGSGPGRTDCGRGIY